MPDVDVAGLWRLLEAATPQLEKSWEELLRVTGMGHHAQRVQGGPPNPARHSIPANRDRDTDLIIGESLDNLRTLLAALPALLSRIERGEKIEAAARRLSEMAALGRRLPKDSPERRDAIRLMGESHVALDALLAEPRP